MVIIAIKTGGASGRVYIDEYGDRSDDHTLLHIAEENRGEFVVVANYFGYRKMYEEVTNITWPGKKKVAPLNKPLCGYLGNDPICQEKSKKEQTQMKNQTTLKH